MRQHRAAAATHVYGVQQHRGGMPVIAVAVAQPQRPIQAVAVPVAADAVASPSDGRGAVHAVTATPMDDGWEPAGGANGPPMVMGTVVRAP